MVRVTIVRNRVRVAIQSEIEWRTARVLPGLGG